MANTPNLQIIKLDGSKKFDINDWNVNIRLLDTAMLASGYWNGKTGHNHRGVIAGNAPKLHCADIALDDSKFTSKNVGSALDEIYNGYINGLRVLKSNLDSSQPFDSGEDNMVTIAALLNTGKTNLADAITSKGVNCTADTAISAMGSKILAIRTDGVELISDAEPEDVFTGKTYLAHTALLSTGTFGPDRGVSTFISTVNDQIIPKGFYRAGSKLLGDANLIPENIVNGKIISGVTGTYLPQQGLYIGETTQAKEKITYQCGSRIVWKAGHIGATSGAEIAFDVNIIVDKASPYHHYTIVVHRIPLNDTFKYECTIYSSNGQKMFTLPSVFGNPGKHYVNCSSYNQASFYVKDSNTNTVKMYSKNGSEVMTLGSSSLQILDYIALNNGDVICVIDEQQGNFTWLKKLLKYNASGAVVWSKMVPDTDETIQLAKKIDGSKVYMYEEDIYEINLATGDLIKVYENNTNIRHLQLDNAGNFYAVRFDYVDEFVGSTYRLKKISPAGSEIWSKFLGNNGDTTYAVTPSGKYVFYNDLSGDDKLCNASTGSDIGYYNSYGYGEGFTTLIDDEDSFYTNRHVSQERGYPFVKSTIVNEYKVVSFVSKLNTDASMSYTPWPDSGALKITNDASYSSGKCYKFDSGDINNGAMNLTMNFTGTGCRIIIGKRPDASRAEVYLDGVQYGYIDGYSAVSTGGGQVALCITGLPNGNHSIGLSNFDIANPNPAATDNNFYFDRIDIFDK